MPSSARRAGADGGEPPVGGASIVPMAPEHLAAVVWLERISFIAPWRAHHFLHELRDNPWARCLVVLIGDEGSDCPDRLLAGYSCVWHLDGELKVNKIAIAPRWRRRGLARWLLAATTAAAIGDGCRVARLEVRASNRSAQRLYAGCGYHIAGRRERYYSDGEAAVLMEASLVPRGDGPAG